MKTDPPMLTNGGFECMNMSVDDPQKRLYKQTSRRRLEHSKKSII